MEISVFGDTNVWLCCTWSCDIDNSWVLLLFTLCKLFALFVDLVGGMGKCEAYPSQI